MTNIPHSGSAPGSAERGVRLGDALAAARADLQRAQPPAYIEAQLLANLQASLPQPEHSKNVEVVLAVLGVSSLPPAPKARWNFWQWLGAGSGGG